MAPPSSPLPGAPRRARTVALLSALAVLLVFLLTVLNPLAEFRAPDSMVYRMYTSREDNVLLQLKINATFRELAQCESESESDVFKMTAELDQTKKDLSYEKGELSRVKAISEKLKEELAIAAKAKEKMEKTNLELSSATQEFKKSKRIRSLLSLKAKKEKVLQKHREEEDFLQSGKFSVNDYIDRASSDWPKQTTYRQHRIVLGPPENGYCHTDNLFSPIPYPWFCHENKDVSLFDSEGKKLNLTYLGQFSQSKNEHVFHYSIEKPGLYTVKSGDVDVSKFAVNPERCYCPEPLESFKKKFQCSREMEQNIPYFFGKWIPGSMEEKFFNKQYMFCTYFHHLIQVSIINNTLYWRYLKKRDSDRRSHFLTSTLKLIQSLLRKVRLPDCEFYLNEYYGNPQVFVNLAPLVLSPNTDNIAQDVAIADSFFWNWIETGEFLKIATRTKRWEEKKSKLFSRLFPLGNFREYQIPQNDVIKLVKEAKKSPNITDVKIVVQSWIRLRNGTLEYLKKEDLVIFHWIIDRDKNGEYKFGVVNLPEFIYPDLLLGLLNGRLMLKPKNLEKRWWFDIVLKNGVNYLEVGPHFEDLIPTLDWAMNHDDLAKKMAQNAFHAIFQKIRPQDAYCWLALGLTEYSKAFNFTPKVRPSMKNLDEEMPKESCDCVEKW